MITLATNKDLEEIDQLAVLVIDDMQLSNIPQWTHSYPRKVHYTDDVLTQTLYIYKDNNKILGVMACRPENDPPYQTITGWLCEKSLVLHRILVHPQYRKSGIAQLLLDFAINKGIKEGYQSIKIDTHLDNYKMRRFLAKNDFIDIGYLEIIDRQAYEKILEV